MPLFRRHELVPNTCATKLLDECLKRGIRTELVALADREAWLVIERPLICAARAGSSSHVDGAFARHFAMTDSTSFPDVGSMGDAQPRSESSGDQSLAQLAKNPAPPIASSTGKIVRLHVTGAGLPALPNSHSVISGGIRSRCRHRAEDFGMAKSDR